MTFCQEELLSNIWSHARKCRFLLNEHKRDKKKFSTLLAKMFLFKSPQFMPVLVLEKALDYEENANL